MCGTGEEGAKGNWDLVASQMSALPQKFKLEGSRVRYGSSHVIDLSKTNMLTSFLQTTKNVYAIGAGGDTSVAVTGLARSILGQDIVKAFLDCNAHVADNNNNSEISVPTSGHADLVVGLQRIQNN
jgi:hypothetical protein